MTPRDWSVFDRPGMRAAFATPGGHGCEVLIALDGIHCSACAARAEAAVAGRARDVRVDLAARTLSLRFEPDRTPLSAILRALDEAGLQPQLLANEEPTDRELRQRRLAVARVGVSTICAMQVMMMAWPGYFGIHPEPGIEQLLRWAQLAISIPGVLWAGWPLLAGGLQAVLRRSLDMNVPVALALATAFGASAVRTVLGAGDLYFDSATMFVWFLTLGRYLESRTRAQALGRTRLLAGRRALTALRRDDGGVHAVPIGELRAGDEVVVPPGEASPVDGGLLDSRADLDESLLTGESLPAVRRRDETVLAGAVNLGAAPLAVRTERIGTATMLAQITQLMQHAQDRKPRVQQVADGLAAHFVALVLLLALAGAGWAAAHGADVDRSMAIAIAVLVASCPCALSLAVPAALAAATSRLAGAGVLVANGALQALARADTVVLDKTGTLTLPGMDLRRIEPRPQQDPARCAAIAAALEAGSRHPLASAFSGKACGMTAVDTEHLPGHGVSGTVEGRRYWLCAPEAAPDGSGEASRGAADEVHIVLHDGTRTLDRRAAAAGGAARRERAAASGAGRGSQQRRQPGGCARAVPGSAPDAVFGAPAAAAEAAADAAAAGTGPGGARRRRWPQRRSSARRGRRVGGDAAGRSLDAGPGRSAAAGRQPGRPADGPGHRPRHGAPHPRKSGLGGGLQPGDAAAGGQRPFAALAGGGGDVAVLAGGGGQRGARLRKRIRSPRTGSSPPARGGCLMASLYLLIPLGVGVVLAAIGIFFWAAQDGQFDGLDNQSARMPDEEP